MTIASPFPDIITVEVAWVKVPEVYVNNVPEVPVRLIAEEPEVNVPPLNVIVPALIVLLAVVNVPAVNVRAFVTVNVAPSAGAPPAPFIVRLYKEGVTEIAVGVPEVPVKETVDVPWVNVPVLFVNNVPLVPDKVIVEALAVHVPEEPRVIVVADRA